MASWCRAIGESGYGRPHGGAPASPTFGGGGIGSRTQWKTAPDEMITTRILRQWPDRVGRQPISRL
jgi:hypothetical protein